MNTIYEPTELESFYLTYHPMTDRETLRHALEDHIRYNTLTVLRDEQGIAAFMRFNIHAEALHVLDLIIRHGLERRGLIKLIAIRTWHKYPFLKFFRFERELKYASRKPRAYSISRLINRV